MSLPTRIIVAVINCISLIVTLVYPNSATPIAVLPLVISVTTWAFLYYDTYTKKGKRSARIVIVISVLLMLYCALLFLMCDVSSHYFVVKPDVVYAAGLRMEYFHFAIPAFVVSIGLMISEFVAVKYKQRKTAKSFHDYVQELVVSEG